METVVSIHRRTDLRYAQILAKAIGQKLQLPIPDAFVEHLADEFGRFRAEAHEQMARIKREFNAEIAAIRDEAARYQAIMAALKALDVALAMPHKRA
jgi:hypothetical protein